MKPSEESPTNGIELASETLAVAFGECNERKSPEDNRRLSVASAHRGGKALFRKFVKENSNSIWKPQLVKSLSAVRFGGYLQEPPTILLQGDSEMLQHIRDAWSCRLLRPPAGYHIDFVGDVTRIGARPLTRGRFVPLRDAICNSIANIAPSGEVATQEAILEEIERSFSDVNSPTRGLLHETLGKLIKNRQVFCTGRGYHLVTTKTYSGKMANKSEEDGPKAKVSFAEGCEACQQNRSTDEDKAKERHHYRNRTRPSQEPKITPKTVVHEDNLHGSVIPNTLNESQPNSEKSPSPKKSSDREKRSSIVEKVAGKLFRRRRKTSTERRKSESTAPSSPLHKSTNTPVRQFSKEEARRLGYEAEMPRRNPNREKLPDRSYSESPVKRTSSTGRCITDRRDTVSPDAATKARINQSPEKKDRTMSPEQVPDLIPEKSSRIGIRKSHSERRPAKHCDSKSISKTHPKTEKLRSPSGNNQFPELRDAAVSCNLEEEFAEQTDHNSRVASPPRQLVPPTERFASPTKDKRLLRRSKSLKLPRERKTFEYDSPPLETFNSKESVKPYPPPDYRSIRRSDTSQGITYDSLRRSMDESEMRRSVSSSSTGKEYSYLHACHFAPSVRVGSVIADHLEELDRRRHYRMHRSSHEMSPSPSVFSSTVPLEVSTDEGQMYYHDSSTSSNIEEGYYDEPVASSHPDQKYCERNVTPQNETEDDASLEQDEQENEESLDTETQAALQVAKRLAKLDIKMTRQEWREYFEEKVLPSHVEEALREANDKEIEEQPSPSTCFANTSGSVETVIDLNQRESSRFRRSRTSTGSSRSSTASDKHAKNRLSSDVHKRSYYAEEYGSLRSTETNRSNDTNNNVDERAEYPVFLKCAEFNYDEDYDSQVFFADDSRHSHLPYREQHRQVGAMDSASLTEDSGFHSSRERSSLSSWGHRKKPRGTFV